MLTMPITLIVSNVAMLTLGATSPLFAVIAITLAGVALALNVRTSLAQRREVKALQAFDALYEDAYERGVITPRDGLGS